MGNWKLTIEGFGPHHNNIPSLDVDLLAKELGEKLLVARHKITNAVLEANTARVEQLKFEVKPAPGELLKQCAAGCGEMAISPGRTCGRHRAYDEPDQG